MAYKKILPLLKCFVPLPTCNQRTILPNIEIQLQASLVILLLICGLLKHAPSLSSTLTVAGTLYLIMAEVLGLASTIIGLTSMGLEISKRLRSHLDAAYSSDSLEDLRRLAAEVEMIVSVLYQLPEILQIHQVILSSNAFESISVTLTQFADILKLLDSFSLTLQANMASPKKSFFTSSFRSRNQIGPMLADLESVKSRLQLLMKLVVKMLD